MAPHRSTSVPRVASRYSSHASSSDSKPRPWTERDSVTEPLYAAPFVEIDGGSWQSGEDAEWQQGATFFAATLYDPGEEGVATVRARLRDRAGHDAEVTLGTLRYDRSAPSLLDEPQQLSLEIYRGPAVGHECCQGGFAHLPCTNDPHHGKLLQELAHGFLGVAGPNLTGHIQMLALNTSDVK